MRAATVHIGAGDDRVVRARVEGEIDLANVAEVGQRLREAVPNDALGMCIDLSSVGYIDSAGIQMLFRLVRDLAACRQGLALAVEVASPVRKLLKITNINEVATVHDCTDDCVTALVAARSDLA